jgi:hypothetical protein
MSLTEVLPEVQSLSRIDKIRLIQFLAQELERDESGLIEPGRSYPIWSPDRAFSAAAPSCRRWRTRKASHDRPSRAVSLCPARSLQLVSTNTAPHTRTPR